MEQRRISLEFSEQMKGAVASGEADPRRGADHAGRSPLLFQLKVRTSDLDAFLDDPAHQATAEGTVHAVAFGGACAVERGLVGLLVDAEQPAVRHMLYRLFFRDSGGRALTLSGRKEVKDDAGPDVWQDTTTLFTRILAGHVAAEEEDRAEVVAAGVLKIEKGDFVHQLGTLRIEGGTVAEHAAGALRFGRFFFGSLWDVYGVRSFSPVRLERSFAREIPLHTLDGVRDAEVSVHPFWTADKLGLSMLRFHRRPCDDVVLIIHGLTTSSDMFIMPEHENLVSHLLDHGFTDVWCLDFRMSNHHPYNLASHRNTMDDVALYDFPPAIAEIRKRVGNRRLHVICHCLGSVSFLMSLFGRAVGGITSVISNSVALTPKVPAWSQVKLAFAPLLLEHLLDIPYVNPRWSEDPGLSRGKLISKLISLFHRECDVPACHMLSLMWGTGWPALYNHENLHEITHRRGGDLYGGTAVHYHRHVRRMIGANNTAVKFDPREPRHAALPDNYFDHAREIETPVLFMTGAQNRVFTDSNVECHSRLEKLVPGRHQLQIFEGYGHQDVFMGKNCGRDIFPRLVRFLEEQRSEAAPAAPGNLAAISR